MSFGKPRLPLMPPFRIPHTVCVRRGELRCNWDTERQWPHVASLRATPSWRAEPDEHHVYVPSLSASCQRTRGQLQQLDGLSHPNILNPNPRKPSRVYILHTRVRERTQKHKPLHLLTSRWHTFKPRCYKWKASSSRQLLQRKGKEIGAK